METNKLTVKDSALSFLLGFLLCQFGVIVATIITLIFYKLINPNSELLFSFLNSAIGYLISAITLYAVMICVFFFFNRKKENKITQKLSVKKLLLYIGVAITSFLMLYPIIVCFDSILIKCGIKLSTLAYPLTTKNYFISLISLVIAPAICEELLFRGLIFKGLQKHGKVFSITISALMFSLFHLSISQTIYPILMGLLLGVIMFYEQNIYYCIAIHLTNNFLSLTLSYFKINLVFNHWTYILIAIILSIIFVSVVLYFTFKNRSKHSKTKLSKTDIIFLSISLGFMLLLWVVNSFI